MKQPEMFRMEHVPVVRLEELLKQGKVSVSPSGKLSGDVTGDVLDPSTWKHRDGWVVMRSTAPIVWGKKSK